MSNEKVDRNLQIYLQKTGRREVSDPENTVEPLTYRKLSEIYNLSIKRVLDIVNRERKKYEQSARTDA